MPLIMVRPSYGLQAGRLQTRARPVLQRAVAMAAKGSSRQEAPVGLSPYAALQDIKVLLAGHDASKEMWLQLTRTEDGELVQLNQEWSKDDIVILAFGRELALQMRRDLIPAVSQYNAKVLLVSIGTLDKARAFAQRTQFPPNSLYADPENLCYNALQLNDGILRTFFSPDTWFAMLERFQKDGAADVRTMLDGWEPWVPPQVSQSTRQGGLFIFQGAECVWSHYDKATSDHASFEEVEAVVRDLAKRRSP